MSDKNNKYTIELSEEQMRLIAFCMDDIGRFAAGQWELQYTIENMVRGLPFDEQIRRRNDAEEHLKQAKRILLPNFADNQSYGYNSTEFIGNIYQITRTIMYQLAIDHNWNNVYSSPALPSGTMGTIKINKVEE
jgi:hypothetical protein